jgi:hypothetical protein
MDGFGLGVMSCARAVTPASLRQWTPFGLAAMQVRMDGMDDSVCAVWVGWMNAGKEGLATAGYRNPRRAFNACRGAPMRCSSHLALGALLAASTGCMELLPGHFRARQGALLGAACIMAVAVVGSRSALEKQSFRRPQTPRVCVQLGRVGSSVAPTCQLNYRITSAFGSDCAKARSR